MDFTNNPGNVFTLLFTLSLDFNEVLDSVRSDPYILFYFLGPNQKMRAKMSNWPRNMKVSNGEVFFSTPFIRVKAQDFKDKEVKCG